MCYNKFNIGDRVTIYGYTKVHNDITAMEFRQRDRTWNYQVGGGSWWKETSLQLIKGDKKMKNLNYKKLDEIIDELQDGSHVFIGEIAEFLIKNETTTHKEVAYIADVIGFPKTRLMEEIRVRKPRRVGKSVLSTARTERF